MSKKVTFDYSKVASFVSDNEVDLMKKQVMDAKEVLVSKTGAGLTYPLPMTRKSLPELKKQLKRSRVIRKSW